MTRLSAILAIAVFSLMIASPAAQAQSDENFIQYRQKVMSSIGANMGAIGDILKNKLPETGNIAVHAQIINMDAKLIAGAFKHKAAEGKTDAKPAVWDQWSKFEEHAQKLEKASAHLAEVAAKGDMSAMGDAVKGVGGACKGCHDDFKKPQAESYKSMK